MHKGGVLFETGTVSRGGQERAGQGRDFLWEQGPSCQGQWYPGGRLSEGGCHPPSTMALWAAGRVIPCFFFASTNRHILH